VDYVFLEYERFQDMVESGEFLEHAQVYGRWYGVPRVQVREALQRGMDVLIKVDIQGAATIKRLVSEGVFIFLAPPSMEELERRLRRRETEGERELGVRLGTAHEEMAQLPLFDYVVVNDRVEQAAIQIDAIITAEKCRVRSRRIQV